MRRGPARPRARRRIPGYAPGTHAPARGRRASPLLCPPPPTPPSCRARSAARHGRVPDSRSRLARRWLSSPPMPASGSSSSSTRGCPASATAISSRRSWPWRSVAAMRPAASARPTRSSTLTAACSDTGSSAAGRSRCRRGTSTACAARRTFSSTVMASMTVLRWKERPMPARASRQLGQPVTSFPSMRMRPESGASSPESRFTRYSCRRRGGR